MCKFVGFFFKTESFPASSRIKATFYHANGEKTSVFAPYNPGLSQSEAHKVSLVKLLETKELKELYPKYEIQFYTEMVNNTAPYWWSVVNPD